MQEHSSLNNIIQTIEKYCNKEQLNHRFVGGVSFGGLVNKQTQYIINLEKKTITLHDHNPLLLMRSDDSIRDIDIIFFCNDNKKLLDFKKFLIDLEREAQKKKQLFPYISVENAIYDTLGIRNPINQFVTALEIDKKGNIYLTFDELQQEISWMSLEPWLLILEDKTEYTVRNPIADYYAYIFRSPGGIKPKDEQKVFVLKKLKEDIVMLGLEHQPQKINFDSDEYYKTWEKYIDKLNKSTSLRIRLKIAFMWLYWRTLGTPLTHGRGLLGKSISPFFNQFTGIKQ